METHFDPNNVHITQNAGSNPPQTTQNTGISKTQIDPTIQSPVENSVPIVLVVQVITPPKDYQNQNKRLAILHQIKDLKQEIGELKNKTAAKVQEVAKKILSQPFTSFDDAVTKLDHDPEVMQLRQQLKEKTQTLNSLKEQHTLLYEAREHIVHVSNTDRLTHFAFKGKAELPPEINAPAGMTYSEHHNFRANSALELLSTVHNESLPASINENNLAELTKDLKGLERICNHRTHLAEYGNRLHDIAGKFYSKDPNADNEVQGVVNDIHSDIDELSNPNSKRVTHLEDGTATFSIPGGWHNPNGIAHAVTYEFRMKKNENGEEQYSFVIHNRGERSPEASLNGTFHGHDSYEIGNKRYEKTRIEIEVSKEALQDKKFLESLLRLNVYASTPADGKTLLLHPYREIHNHLILSNGGKFAENEVTKIRNKLLELMGSGSLTPEEQQASLMLYYKLLETDPDYHSLQFRGTCTDSNATGVEKDMATPTTHRCLKLFTINQLTKNARVESDYVNELFINASEDVRQPIKLSQSTQEALSKEKMDALRAKIERPPQEEDSSILIQAKTILAAHPNKAPLFNDLNTISERLQEIQDAPKILYKDNFENMDLFWAEDDVRNRKTELMLMKEQARVVITPQTELNKTLALIDKKLNTIDNLLALANLNKVAVRSFATYLTKIKEFEDKLKKFLEKPNKTDPASIAEANQLKEEATLLKYIGEGYAKFRGADANEVKSINLVLDERIASLSTVQQ